MELSPSAPQALRAQAIVARTFTFSALGRHRADAASTCAMARIAGVRRRWPLSATPPIAPCARPATKFSGMKGSWCLPITTPPAAQPTAPPGVERRLRFPLPGGRHRCTRSPRGRSSLPSRASSGWPCAAQFTAVARESSPGSSSARPSWNDAGAHASWHPGKRVRLGTLQALVVTGRTRSVGFARSRWGRRGHLTLRGDSIRWAFNSGRPGGRRRSPHAPSSCARRLLVGRGERGRIDSMVLAPGTRSRLVGRHRHGGWNDAERILAHYFPGASIAPAIGGAQ